MIYHEGKYYLYEPKNSVQLEDDIIENHLWIIVKFLPKSKMEVKLGDVVRFG